AHPLVMSHVGADYREPFTSRHAGWGVVKGFIVTKASLAAFPDHRCVVSRGGNGVDHCGERRRVWGNYLIRGKAALETQAANTKIGILIRELQVARIESRLGNTPWNSQ